MGHSRRVRIQQRKKILLGAFYKAEEPWSDLFNMMSWSISNRNKGEYPYAKLNSDNSISIFLSTEPHIIDEKQNIACSVNRCDHSGCISRRLERTLRDDRVVPVLKYLRRRNRLELTGSSTEMFERLDHPDTDLVEIKLNVSPEDLDNIFRECNFYTGYTANETSILKLSKQFTEKTGFIRLFPVLQMDDHSGLIRAAGCQLVEMPAVQLLHLLPDYHHEDSNEYFHWVPKKLDKLINGTEIQNALGRLLLKDGCRDTSNFCVEQLEDGFSSIRITDNGSVRVTAMDDADRDFYAIYGNIGIEELEACRSLEVDTLSFLRALRETMMESRASGTAISRCDAAIATIDIMISREESRLSHVSNQAMTEDKEEYVSESPIQPTESGGPSPKICLLPVAPGNTETSTIEINHPLCAKMAMLQLMPLLPNFDEDSKDMFFRNDFFTAWSMVWNKLFVDGFDINRAVWHLFLRRGLVDSDLNRLIRTDVSTAQNPGEKTSDAIRVVPMDDNARELYIRHGLVRNEILDRCQSLEITPLELMQSLREILLEKRELVRKMEWGRHHSQHADAAIANIDIMIHNERLKQSAAEEKGVMSSHPSFFHHPPEKKSPSNDPSPTTNNPHL